MIDPFLRAVSTKCFSCSLVAAAPVGLFGEQKKMMSDFSAYRTHRFSSVFVSIGNTQGRSRTASSAKSKHTSHALLLFNSRVPVQITACLSSHGCKPCQPHAMQSLLLTCPKCKPHTRGHTSKTVWAKIMMDSYFTGLHRAQCHQLGTQRL